MGKRRLSFDMRKNCERKRYLKLNVRIPLKLTKLFQVSLPLCNYTHTPAANGETLRARLRKCQLPTHWSLEAINTTTENTAINTPSPCFTLYTVRCSKPPSYVAEVTFSLTVHSDLTWILQLGSLPVLPSQVPRAPIRLLNISDVMSLLETLDSVRLCVGNPEDRYLQLVDERGPLKDNTGTIIIIITFKK